MKTWMAITATIPFLTGCMVEVDSTSSTSTTPYGNGVTVAETRGLAYFSSVETHGNIQVSIQEGNRYEAVVTTDGNLTSYLATEVQGGKLIIDWSRYTHVTGTPSVVVTVPQIENLRNYGRADVSIEQSTWWTRLSLETYGSGSIHYLGAAENLTAVSHSSGRIDLIGYADALEARTENSGEVIADGLLAADAFAEVYASGDITLDLDQNAWLSVRILGSGDVEWWGFPSKTAYELQGSGRIIEHKALAKAAAGSPALKYKAMKPKT